jgi:hypothetical protein
MVIFLMAAAGISRAATITVTDQVKGHTPYYLGMNRGGTWGDDQNRYYGDPEKYGMMAYWMKRLPMNHMRHLGHALWDEGTIDSPDNSNDNGGDGINAPENGITSETAFNRARADVLSDPLNNEHINWAKFDHVKMCIVRQVTDMGIEGVADLRFKHGGEDGFPSYMGGDGWGRLGGFDVELSTWQRKWEWWEYAFAMSWLYYAIGGVTLFEIGNEPEFGKVGGLTVKGQIVAVQYGEDAVREAVRLASGGNDTAYIISCGTNKTEYLQAMLDNTDTDALSFHVYGKSAENKFDVFEDVYALSPKLPIWDTESEGIPVNDLEDNDFTYDMGAYFHYVYSKASDRMKCISVWSPSKMLDRIEPDGLWKPATGYYLMRLYYRAGIRAKTVYWSSSSDPDLNPVVTQDEDYTYIIVKNESSDAKSYTIAPPPDANGNLQHVFLWEYDKYNDEAWDGVAESGGEIGVSAQPGKSYLQVVYGEKALPDSLMPVAWDPAKYTMTHLAEPFLPASYGTVIQSYTENFNTTPGPIDIGIVDHTDWQYKGYLVEFRPERIDFRWPGWGILFNNRLYIADMHQCPSGREFPIRTLWSANQFAINGESIRMQSDVGSEESGRRGGPRQAFVYRDNNGNVLAVRIEPALQKGTYECITLDTPSSLVPIFDEQEDNVVWRAQEEFGNNARVSLEIGENTVRCVVSGLDGKEVENSGEIHHGISFSGTGRIGLAKYLNYPLWFDNISITSGGEYPVPAAPIRPQRTQACTVRPVRNGFRVSLPHVTGTASISVFDCSGRRYAVHTVNSSGDCFIDCATESGVWIVTATDSNGRIVTRTLIK